jgi:hypothetical protein
MEPGPRPTGWLIVAVTAGVLAAIGWIARERRITRRHRGAGPSQCDRRALRPPARLL